MFCSLGISEHGKHVPAFEVLCLFLSSLEYTFHGCSFPLYACQNIILYAKSGLFEHLYRKLHFRFVCLYIKAFIPKTACGMRNTAGAQERWEVLSRKSVLPKPESTNNRSLPVPSIKLNPGHAQLGTSGEGAVAVVVTQRSLKLLLNIRKFYMLYSAPPYF